MADLIHEKLSEEIIGAAMTVLNELKPGLDEKLYENALIIELQDRGHRIDQQKTFNWEDPLDLASRLSEEERMVWESARAYAREKLLPRVVSAFAQERFDREIMTEMGALGFLGPTLPEQ